MRDLPHIASRVFGTPLLIDSRKLDAIVPAFLKKLNDDDDDDFPGAPRDLGEPTIANGIAVIPVIGTLVRRKSMLEAVSGLTSYHDIRCAVQCALDDARARAILLDIDTFGGEATGCFEFCDWLYAQRGKKPIWAVADVDALSAGYAILSQADRALIAPSGSAGSIGAVCVHCERSKMDEAIGLTYTVIRSGLRKADLNQFEPLTAQAAEKVQGSLDTMRSKFINIVSRARNGLSKAGAANTEGQWYDSDDAVRLRLVDGIATLEDALAQLAAAAPEVPMPMNTPSLPQAPAPVEDDDDDEDEDKLQLPLPDDDDEDEDEEMLAMPVPQPKKGESQDDYHSRCMGDETMQEYDQDQRNAICYRTWQDKDKSKTEASAMDHPKEVNADLGDQPKVVDIETARKQGAADAREIAELCTIFGRPQLAAEFIVAGKSLADVRKVLIDARAKDDEDVGHLTNQPPSPAALKVNSEKIWEDAFSKVWASSYGRTRA